MKPFGSLLALLLLLPLNARAVPLAGRWEGVFHGGRGDQPLVLICRPTSDGKLGGALYLNGDLVGPLEHGEVSGDSLRFRVMNFSFRGRRDDDRMTLELAIAHGSTHELAFRFAAADTSSPAPSAAAAARNGASWDQVPDSVLAAHRMATNVGSGMTPAAQQGTLFLVGGGPSQADVDTEFVRLAGGSGARIVVIPTAGVDQADTLLLQAGTWARTLGVDHVTVLHAISRTEANSETLVKPLREATGVWLSGGEADRILARYLGTRTETELFALLARGGVIGGTSAGALVWGSETQIFRAPADGSPFAMGNADSLVVGDPHAVGFGALRNVVVVPHFSEFKMQPSFEKTLAAHPYLLGIGIDEATAFEIHANVGTVFGRGDVRIAAGSEGHHALAMGAGARYDVAKRSLLDIPPTHLPRKKRRSHHHT
jgi:cyanophycinase